jgi:hypothetical protein
MGSLLPIKTYWNLGQFPKNRALFSFRLSPSHFYETPTFRQLTLPTCHDEGLIHSRRGKGFFISEVLITKRKI